jgi:hypothetical protein
LYYAGSALAANSNRKAGGGERQQILSAERPVKTPCCMIRTGSHTAAAAKLVPMPGLVEVVCSHAAALTTTRVQVTKRAEQRDLLIVHIMRIACIDMPGCLYTRVNHNVVLQLEQRLSGWPARQPTKQTFSGIFAECVNLLLLK